MNFGERGEAISRLLDFKENEIKLKKMFIEIGKNIVGEKFNVPKEHAVIITNLLKYFTGNKGEYNLDKGIYLHGGFGAGKTTLFRIIRSLLAHIAVTDPYGKRINPNGFLITSIENIIETYKNDGNLEYFGYSRETTPIHLCINEFGKKVNDKIYGTDANEIINSLFMIRYELFQNGKLTHVTSNFHPKQIQIESILIDRMIEMFNFIELKGNSLRN
jgi:predicted ATPase